MCTASHTEQADMIRRHITWRSNHAYHERLCRIVDRANVALFPGQRQGPARGPPSSAAGWRSRALEAPRMPKRSWYGTSGESQTRSTE